MIIWSFSSRPEIWLWNSRDHTSFGLQTSVIMWFLLGMFFLFLRHLH